MSTRSKRTRKSDEEQATGGKRVATIAAGAGVLAANGRFSGSADPPLAGKPVVEVITIDSDDDATPPANQPLAGQQPLVLEPEEDIKVTLKMRPTAALVQRVIDGYPLPDFVLEGGTVCVGIKSTRIENLPEILLEEWPVHSQDDLGVPEFQHLYYYNRVGNSIHSLGEHKRLVEDLLKEFPIVDGSTIYFDWVMARTSNGDVNIDDVVPEGERAENDDDDLPEILN